MKLKIALISFFFLVVIGIVGLLLYTETKSSNAVATVHTPLPIQERQTAQTYLLPITQPSYIPIRDFNHGDPLLSANAAIVYDLGSKRTLFTKNAEEQLPIASITKIMTAVAIVENMDLDATYTVSVEDLNLDGYGPDLFSNEKLRGIDLLKLMLIESSNDAAAVFVSAGLDQGIDIIEKMNEKALDLGMYNTYYNDPAGLDDYKTYSTAADQVELFKYVTLNRPEIWDILGVQSTSITSTVGGITHQLDNTNRLLGTIPEIIGGKTGLTDGAQGTMSAVVEVNNAEDVIIAIVLGTPNRFSEMQQLIDWTNQAHTW